MSQSIISKTRKYTGLLWSTAAVCLNLRSKTWYVISSAVRTFFGTQPKIVVSEYSGEYWPCYLLIDLMNKLINGHRLNMQARYVLFI